MNIRIHKVLGYACDSFVKPKNFDELFDRAYDTTLSEFFEWCRSNEARILSRFSEDAAPSMRMRRCEFGASINSTQNFLSAPLLGEFVHIDEECGIAGLIVLRPPERTSSMFRYDDEIDHYEEQSLHRDSEPKLIKLQRGIYPHDRGEIPIGVFALCSWLDVPELFDRLEEAIYTWWA